MTFTHASIDFARIARPIVDLPLDPGYFSQWMPTSHPMATIQAHYACSASLRCRSSVFFAMTKFTKAQDTNR